MYFSTNASMFSTESRIIHACSYFALTSFISRCVLFGMFPAALTSRCRVNWLMILASIPSTPIAAIRYVMTLVSAANPCNIANPPVNLISHNIPMSFDIANCVCGHYRPSSGGCPQKPFYIILQRKANLTRVFSLIKICLRS